MTGSPAVEATEATKAIRAMKDGVRARIAASRRARPDPERDAARSAIRELVLARCESQGWRCVAAYVPLRSEPGSTALLDGLAALGARVLVPVTLPDRDLDWTPWPVTEPGRDALGRDALGDADAILVPALAVATADGTRLGRGGGSYDRSLPRRRAGAVVVALLFDGETAASLPADPWDVPVDAVVSPAGWMPTGASARNTGARPPA